MPAAADRLEFAPPPQPGRVRAFVLAVVAHLLLMLALTWGINWNRESENVAAEAELWSSVPQQAAPTAVQVPPPPHRPHRPRRNRPRHGSRPHPPPARAERRPISRWSAKSSNRNRRCESRRNSSARRSSRRARSGKNWSARRSWRRARKQEAAEASEQLGREESGRGTQKKEEQVKAAKAKTAAAGTGQEARRPARGADAPNPGPGQAPRAAPPRPAPPSARPARRTATRAGSARESGPTSCSRTTSPAIRRPKSRCRWRRTAPSRAGGCVKSSGVRSWDEAVLRALDKTEILPRDVDGRVHSPLIIEFRPKG